MAIRQTWGSIVRRASVTLLVACAVRARRRQARAERMADERQRQLQRDLHDGAQQRLVALALRLLHAERGLDRDLDDELSALLRSTAAELHGAVRELRDLAHGSPPQILARQGLAGALGALADRTPLPVKVRSAAEQLPREVEAAAYFVASEGLANVLKHAGATRATITSRRDGDTLVVEIADDGVGGASTAGGTGLRCLAGRVETLGGRLWVESAPGAGTRLVGELPCVP